MRRITNLVLIKMILDITMLMSDGSRVREKEKEKEKEREREREQETELGTCWA